MATTGIAAQAVGCLVRLPRRAATARAPWPALVPPSWRTAQGKGVGAAAAHVADAPRLAQGAAAAGGGPDVHRDEDGVVGAASHPGARPQQRPPPVAVAAAASSTVPRGRVLDLAPQPSVAALYAATRPATAEGWAGGRLVRPPRGGVATAARDSDCGGAGLVRLRRLSWGLTTTHTLAVSVPVGTGIVRRAASSSASPGGSGAPSDGQAKASTAAAPSGSSTSTAVSVASSSSEITWRNAFKSPRTAVLYTRSLGVALADWARHFWASSKLLATDVRGSWRIVKRLIKGKTLSRRERNFLIGTGSDLARLVPFSLFLLIPFMEFALPFALKLFPNMLPSQFQDAMKAEEDLKRQLKVKIELAKYLRDVVEEKARVLKSSSSAGESVRADAEALTTFLASIRDGKPVDPADVNRFARLFSDEITLDGAVRPQLVAMCKYMGLSPYGADPFLRYKIRSRLNSIAKDDMQIAWEGGVDRLTEDEVARACRDRGIRTVGISHRWRARQLREWLEMSQSREIPASLMILSRAFLFSDVSEALGSLPEGVIDDVKSKSAGELTSAERLEEVRRQRKLIEAEEEREARAEAEKALEKEKKAATAAAAAAAEAESKADAEAAAGEAPVDADAAAAPPAGDGELLSDRQLADKMAADGAEPGTAAPTKAGDVTVEADAAPTAVVSDSTADATPAADAREEEEDSQVSAEERKVAQDEAISRIAVSLGDLSSTSAVESERLELESLKAELAAAESTIRSTTAGDAADQNAAAAAGDESEAAAAAAAAKPADAPPADGPELRRLRKLVKNLERDVARVDSKVGLKLKLLDADNDGVISLEEATKGLAVLAGDVDEEAIRETLRRLDADEDGNFNRGDLRRLMKELQDGTSSSPSSVGSSASAGSK